MCPAQKRIARPEQSALGWRSALLFSGGLARAAPGAGPASDGFARQRAAMPGTCAVPVPALVEEPSCWKSGITPAEASDGFTAEEPDGSPEISQFRAGQLAGERARGQPGPPKDFVGHPIAQARKTLLQEQRAFEGKLVVVLEKCGHEFPSELLGSQWNRQIQPPTRRCGPEVKSDAAKLPRIRKHERLGLLIKDQVIVLAGWEARFRGAQFSGHP